MELQNVKLVITDMDGTLLNAEDKVSDRFFELEHQLRHKGVQFVAASGRQYYSIREKLDAIKDEIYIVAENGAFVKHREEELMVKTLDQSACQNFIEIARKIEDAHIVLCGKKHGYVESKNQDFLEHFKEYYRDYKQTEDLTSIENDDFLKIAIYSFTGSRKNTYPDFKKFENDFKVKVSGENWLDISNNNTDKGSAIALLQDRLAISKGETMAFGDYDNDLEMLDQAHFSYAMANASDAVKNAARFSTTSNNENGVVRILEELLEAKS